VKGGYILDAVKRALLFVAAAAGVLGPAALAARNVPRTLAVKTTVTGEITRLGLDRIAIGRVGCAIPTKLEVRAGRFVVSDPVRISCRNGKLQSVKYSPELATAQSDRPGFGNAPTTVPTPPPSSGSGGTTLAYSIGVLYLGGPPPGETTTVTGQISDVSSTSVTVSGLTCTFRAFPNFSFQSGPAVGDNVNLTCTGGLLIRLASVGIIQR